VSRLVIALGDPAGIGAEVCLRALARVVQQRGSIDVVLVGCRQWLRRTHRHLRPLIEGELADPEDFEVLDLPLPREVEPGQPGALTGEASFRWLDAAVAAVQAGRGQALVTAPIAKEHWHAAGHRLAGQTDRLAQLCDGADAAMLFTAVSPHSGWRFNTLLATTHVPLAGVPTGLNPDLVQRRLQQLQAFCGRFNSQPSLAVAGVNPHAGEAGVLGEEEQRWLSPLLEEWRRQHPDRRLQGPLPPDTCWLGAARAWQSREATMEGADGYLAMYHDQGLIPVKLLAFDQAVNTTLGLPFLRTSPDHGTAFDLAGRGLARPDSMEAAILTALDLG
jgi:4-hydroxythreonine-4-phosphate dehydrogenase